MAFILLQKVITFFLIMVGGYAVVKAGILKGSDSKVLSLLFLYLIMPCGIINAFQVDFTPQVRTGLLFALVIAILVHVILIVTNMVIRKPLKLDPVEQSSIIYPACANLTIPLIIATMGQEMVIYASAYLAVQLFMLWGHCKSLLCGEKGIDLKKVLSNINMIAIMIGIVLLMLRIPLPGPVNDAVSTLGGMMGTISMLVAGMLVAEVDLKEMFKNKRVWFITFLRLIVCPIYIILIFKFTGLANLVPGGKELLLVTIMGIIGPPASSITQMAQVYTGNDEMASYASSITVMATIICMITMPIMVAIW